MKNKLYKSLVVIFYLLSLFILLYCIKVRITPNIYLYTNFKLILLSFVCILIYMSGLIAVKKLNYNKKILKINLITYFLIYIVTIFTLTLFDEIFGRRGLVIVDWNKDLLQMYAKTSLNIIPFKTVTLFISGYINGKISFNNFIMNVLGNFCAFMPFAVFLPLLFKSMNKYRNFLLVMIITVIIIELLQFVTLSGSCDIDDLILNVMGASIVFLIIKVNCINKFIHKVFLFE